MAARALTTILLLCLLVRPALAGPNGGGVLLIHDAGLAYSAGSDGCAQGTTPASCDECDVTLEGSAPNAAQVWKVYAAFPPTAEPRLKALTFGIDYVESDGGTPGLVILAAEACAGQSGRPAAEYVAHGWPGPQGGTSLVFSVPLATRMTEVCWFAGYRSGDEPQEFALGPHPDPALDGNFADDSVPARLDRILAYGNPWLRGRRSRALPFRRRRLLRQRDRALSDYHADRLPLQRVRGIQGTPMRSDSVQSVRALLSGRQGAGRMRAGATG
jgi:hypothetical protein